MSVRMKPKDRRAEVLEAALRAAEQFGVLSMTRDQIAVLANCSPGLVSARLGSMENTRASVMRLAVKRGSAAVVAQGLALRDKHALNAPEDLKKRALEHLAGL